MAAGVGLEEDRLGGGSDLIAGTDEAAALSSRTPSDHVRHLQTPLARAPGPLHKMETVREASVKEVPREQRFHGLAGKLQGHFELLSRRLLSQPCQPRQRPLRQPSSPRPRRGTRRCVPRRPPPPPCP